LAGGGEAQCVGNIGVDEDDVGDNVSGGAGADDLAVVVGGGGDAESGDEAEGARMR
jgi:hypothetical protein